VSTVVRSMRSTLARVTFLLSATVLAAGCAAQPGSGSEAAGSTTPQASLPDDGGLVLQVEYVGGFMTPQANVGRLPLVSVYADGRVITEGPVAAIYPGPALPNLQVAHVEPEKVQELAQQALDAGVGRDDDYGMAGIADAPSTRFTVVTADGPEVSEVPALADGPLTSDAADGSGLTEEQIAGRARLQALLQDITAAGGAASEPYVPTTVVAVVGPDLAPGATPKDVATWPGPPLPGDQLSPWLELYCVAAEGEAADAVLEAAAKATGETVWKNPDGGRWSVTLRPLLPHETGCGDLPRI
jgi:hypothetical protein